MKSSEGGRSKDGSNEPGPYCPRSKHASPDSFVGQSLRRALRTLPQLQKLFEQSFAAHHCCSVAKSPSNFMQAHSVSQPPPPKNTHTPKCSSQDSLSCQEPTTTESCQGNAVARRLQSTPANGVDELSPQLPSPHTLMALFLFPYRQLIRTLLRRPVGVCNRALHLLSPISGICTALSRAGKSNDAR